MREAGGVGVLVDQHAGDAGLWLPFFGRLASTSPLAATLALRTGAVLLPTAVHTDVPGHWRLVIDPPIEPAGHDTNSLTAALNQRVENQIRRLPSDRLWGHNRWKTPKPNFLLATYHRRGGRKACSYLATRLPPDARTPPHRKSLSASSSAPRIGWAMRS